MAFIDLDGLKLVNDNYGHSAGDRLIASLGTTLRAAVRSHDVLGRLGGDEFAVFAPGLGVEALRHRLVDAIGALGSVGVAPLRNADHLQEALLVADRRMYQAKRARRRFSSEQPH